MAYRWPRLAVCERDSICYVSVRERADDRPKSHKQWDNWSSLSSLLMQWSLRAKDDADTNLRVQSDELVK